VRNVRGDRSSALFSVERAHKSYQPLSPETVTTLPTGAQRLGVSRSRLRNPGSRGRTALVGHVHSDRPLG
jgi:hypothetical protein